MNRVSKYSSIVLLFIVMYFNTRVYDDFTASNKNIYILSILIILIAVNIIVLYYLDYKRKISRNYTHFVLITLSILFGLHIYKNVIHYEKKVSAQFYVSPNFQENYLGYNIKLNEDSTFEINEYWHGESEHYFGKYSIVADTLRILDEKIEKKTDNQITFKYFYDKKNHNYKSVEQGFLPLKFQK